MEFSLSIIEQRKGSFKYEWRLYEEKHGGTVILNGYAETIWGSKREAKKALKKYLKKTRTAKSFRVRVDYNGHIEIKENHND